jgi:predicted nucleotide-binding protein
MKEPTMARRAAPPQPQSANLTVDQMRRGIDRLKLRIADLEAFDPRSVQQRWGPEVKALETSIEETLAAVFGHNTVEYNRYDGASRLDRGPVRATPDWIGARSGGLDYGLETGREFHRYLEDGKQQAILLLKQAVRGLEEEISARSDIVEAASGDVTPAVALDLSKIFVVHGHERAPKAEVARFIEKLGFEAIILHERPNKGRTLITKFREEAAGVGFAVVLMTPDDVGKAEDAASLRSRARQNVVFELGFFIGKLGSERVAALVKGDIELPSDYDGVVYISLDKEDWQSKLGMELQEAGYKFDWNTVMRR